MAKQQRTTKSIEKLEGYEQLLKDVKSIIERGLSRAYQAVDNIRVRTYWQVGERVTREELVHQDRADYGERLIEQLARDLEYSRRLMYEIVRFYKTYPIVHALHAQLSWTHYRQLIAIEDKEERDFYEIQTITNHWSFAQDMPWSTCGKMTLPLDDPIQIGIHAIGMIDRTIYCGSFKEGTATIFRKFQLWTR